MKVNLNDLANNIQQLYNGTELKEYFYSKYLQYPLDRRSWIYQIAKKYKNLKNRTYSLFGSKIIDVDDDDLKSMYEKYLRQSLSDRDFYKIADKEDVEYFFNWILREYSMTFDRDRDFIELLELVHRSTWFKDWNFLTRI